MYLDSAYIAKFYLNEPDSSTVRAKIATAERLSSSQWAVAEVASAIHRYSGALDPRQVVELVDAFEEHVNTGFWELHPVTAARLWQVANMMKTAPRDLFLRSGDALHIATALAIGETEIWSNDRHLLAAAPHFGLKGLSIP